MNQNFAALDTAVAEVKEAAAVAPYVVGTYVGNGKYMAISLGFRPSFVIVTGALYTDNDTYWRYTAFVTENTPKYQAVLTDDGFEVRNSTSYYPYPAENGRTYAYIAFR
jgi:hypothetical protein